MIVCVCRRVSDREITRHAHAGMSFDDIQFELGVATQCGRCECTARGLVEQCHASNPVAAINNAACAEEPAHRTERPLVWNSSFRSQPA
ncbi:(2Fe-2S)-binding protein [Lampropedia aestuarii]|uniref:(2Fe-2S)-binding protein n=1 Tax=Lampropedia aestuarii TaxID=2562762 RepID=UPI00246952F6|nr:(2Fe-2S)-binding protein [Lampropedia aestuarii]MDH5856185.1 (2Fe-2S)-binding protein [Lampropedia aestuarii]